MTVIFQRPQVFDVKIVALSYRYKLTYDDDNVVDNSEGVRRRHPRQNPYVYLLGMTRMLLACSVWGFRIVRVPRLSPNRTT